MSTKPSRELGNILRSVPAATALEDTAAAIQPTERNAPAGSGATSGGEGELTAGLVNSNTSRP